MEQALARIDNLVKFAVAVMFLLAPLAASGAADAARGRTLYVTTYACSDCHDANPTRFTVPPAPTVDALLLAIQTVPALRSRYSATLAQNPTDLADLAAYLASVAGVSTGPDIDQHGLTGSWYDAAESGQGIEAEFYVDLVAPGTALVSGAWFTFDSGAPGAAERQRWYVFNGNAVRGAASIPITIGQNIGGNFNAPPVTTPSVVGTGTLAFTDCTTGSLTYALSDGTGRSGTIPITRITPNVTCATNGVPATNADFALSGNWYDPTTSGQGFVFEVNPLAPVVFFAWYTYSPAGRSAGASGQRWYTGQGAFAPGTRTIALTLGETIGGVFDQPTPGGQKTNAVGTATVTFTSCTSATLQYAFTGGTSVGRSGTIALTRVGPVPPGCTS